MSQSTSKSVSCLEILGTLQVSVHPDSNPCFSAWSTLALFDYLQSDIPLNKSKLPLNQRDQTEPDHFENRTLDQTDGESVRAELQELLRRAYSQLPK